jgi:hypothetical protein
MVRLEERGMHAFRHSNLPAPQRQLLGSTRGLVDRQRSDSGRGGSPSPGGLLGSPSRKNSNKPTGQGNDQGGGS